MKTRLLLLSLALTACHAEAQVPPRVPARPAIDVEAYAFDVTVSDTSDRIHVLARVEFVPTASAAAFWLDLVGPQADGTGMTVTAVEDTRGRAAFVQQGDRLYVTPTDSLVPGQSRVVQITYGGVPDDGLIIATNTHGDRTFFADHWPERARHWLSVVDHPADKARVTWRVTAPARVQTVANGSLVERTCAAGTCTATYRTDVPIPTKVMVFGAAPFAVEEAGRVRDVPVETWVYAQDRTAGFYDYALAVPILAFFDSLLTPFPFEKLANVQSKTRYGGMENAGAIFYAEASVRGDRGAETLLAHEIVHQWFGDHVTEVDWPHLWLSEGFATYLTTYYVEQTKGEADARVMRQQQRETVLGYYEQNRDPLIDTTYADPNELLNPNAYQRGGWVLHMLRRHVARIVEASGAEAMPGMAGEGDAAFFDGLRRYLDAHGGGNAATSDLQQAMESVAGHALDPFFEQWTRLPGQPTVRATWQRQNGEVFVTVEQMQEEAPFTFPLEIGYVVDGQVQRTETVEVQDRTTSVRLPDVPGASLVLDPGVHLLFDNAGITERR